jgi:hypothetical protein
MKQDDLIMALSPEAFGVSLGFVPDHWQALVMLELSLGNKRMLLNIHRQGGKSQLAALLSAWWTIYHPDSLVLLISPSLRQSLEIMRKVYGWFDRMPARPKFSEENKTSFTLSNGARVVALPSSEETVRGYSAVNLLIMDEASRISDDLFQAVSPFLAVSDGAVIGQSTPAGKRGWWHEAWSKGGEDWKRFEVTAEECPRISAEWLESEKRSNSLFAQEFECQFISDGLQIFDQALLDGCIDPEFIPLFERIKT